jgi:hypothetical protein
MHGLRRRAAREVPQGYPRFGYMLDHDGMPVGVLLLLYSLRPCAGKRAVNCNLSRAGTVWALSRITPSLRANGSARSAAR